LEGIQKCPAPVLLCCFIFYMIAGSAPPLGLCRISIFLLLSGDGNF
jgi:hypothetical protein